MTSAERLAIFRPKAVEKRLDASEQAFVDAAMVLSLRQLEMLKIEYELMTPVDELQLVPHHIVAMADALAASLITTYKQGRRTALYELKRAEAAQFAVDKLAEDLPSEFYPKAGVDWYREYSLRIVGVEQTAALEGAKQSIRDGIEQGLTHRDVMTKLSEDFTDLSKHRLEMIARTETSKIYSQSRYQTFQPLEQVVGWEWFAIMDSRVCDVCEAREHRIFPKDQIEGNMPPVHVQCVLPGTRLEAPCGIVAGLRSWYDGQAVKFTFADGRELSVTENHLFPTLYGFAAAKSLRKGDNVFSRAGFERVSLADPDASDVPTLAEDVISALAEYPGMITKTVPAAAEYLHGDARFVNSNIDVIASNGFLGGAYEPPTFERFTENDFSAASVGAVAFSGDSQLAESLFRYRDAFDGGMSSRSESEFFSRRRLGHSQEHSLALVAGGDSEFPEPGVDNNTVAPKLLSERLDGHTGVIEREEPVSIDVDTTRAQGDTLACQTARNSALGYSEACADLVGAQAGLIEPLEIVNVERFPYQGHVYDLQTLSSLYICNGIIASNCRCVLAPVLSFEVDNGSVQWNPIPEDAPPVMDGFGSTSMVIPPRTPLVSRI
jgi:SPP1 gp7 family putative phage head morphogenesis protein